VRAMNDLPDAIDRLTKRIDTLERRVDALEHPLAARWPHASAETKAESTRPEIPGAPADRSGALFPVLGKALLGIAGAYLMRAVEEASPLPKVAVAMAGLAYAFLWLILAARSRGGTKFAGAIYACTSALILAPMLWELTLRFTVLSTAMAAGVVCAYALAALALAWKRALDSLLRVAFIAAAGLALALAIASHVMMPFLAVLLVLAAVCEFAPQIERLPEVRALVALAADVAVWVLIFVYFNPQYAREDYPAISEAALLALGIALFLLFAAAVIFRTVLRAKQITVFETVQTTIAFLLAAVSLADFGPSYSPILLGAVCLLLSVAGYAAVFTIFERASERRNAAVFAAWSAALLLAGSFLCLPPLAVVLLLGAAAAVATVVGRREDRPPFGFYGLVFLVAASATAGLLSFITKVWFETPPGSPTLVVWVAALCAILCYAVAWPGVSETRPAQALHFAFAALASGASVSLMARALFALVAINAIPGAHHLAFIRTLTLCAASLTSVFAGARWRRTELTRLGYLAMGLAAVKLAIEDLRHGHLAYIAASIFLVALTLIAAPRLARAKQRTRGVKPV